MFAALFERAQNADAFAKGLKSNVFTEAAESCLPLAMDAFRCADLQGRKNPLEVLLVCVFSFFFFFL
jgi:hypothetical protein